MYGIHVCSGDIRLIPSHMQGALTLLSRGALDLGGPSVADQTVSGLEVLHGLGGVVEEGEAGALATTVLGAETEDRHGVLVGLVELGELLAELVLGDVGPRWVEDVTAVIRIVLVCRCRWAEEDSAVYAHDHLLAAEQWVADKLARAQGHLAFRHDCGGNVWMSGVGGWC